MKRSWILAPVLGMVALVGWGMIFWGLLAGSLGVFHKLPNDFAVAVAISSSGAPTGTYFMPWPRSTPKEREFFEAQHKQGPFYRLSFVREGVDPGSPKKLLLGCLHYFSVAMLATLLVWISGPGSFGKHWSMVFLGGSLGSNLITLGDPVWFHMPWDYTRGVLLYEVVAWALLGAVTAALCPMPARVAPSVE